MQKWWMVTYPLQTHLLLQKYPLQTHPSQTQTKKLKAANLTVSLCDIGSCACACSVASVEPQLAGTYEQWLGLISGFICISCNTRTHTHTHTYTYTHLTTTMCSCTAKPTELQLRHHVVQKVPPDEWKAFCQYLGLSSTDIQHCEANERTVTEQFFSALLRWRRGKGKMRTWGSILTAFSSVGLAEDKEELQECILHDKLKK